MKSFDKKKRLMAWGMVALCAAVCVVSCEEEDFSMEENNVPEGDFSIHAGRYDWTVLLEVNEGEKREPLTRRYVKGDDNTNNINDDGDGATYQFFEHYEYDVIYVHSTSEPNKVLPIAVTDTISACENTSECVGFRMYVDIADDGSTTLYNYDPNFDKPADGQSVILEPADSIYFSSWPEETWEATRVENDGVSPLSQSPVFVLDTDVNRGLYRSVNRLGGNVRRSFAVTEILDIPSSSLHLDRLISAFQVRFVVTEADKSMAGFYLMDEEMWKERTGTDLSDWSIKLYLGPLFPQYYNLNTQKGFYDEQFSGGYYATNQQKYVAFSPSLDIMQDTGEDQGTVYRGPGLRTNKDFLLSPFILNTPDCAAYVFIKYKGEDESSDVGAKWLKVDVAGLGTQYNVTERVNIVLDIDQLASAFKEEIEAGASSTEVNVKRGVWNTGMEQLDVPVKVFITH